MRRKHKKSRRNRGKEVSDDLDRLSCLPDSILTYILSFLDTKSSIRTSVLSKRYKLLWTSLPCLDFKLSGVHTDSFGSYRGYDFYRVKNTCVCSFESYVSHVLGRREHSNLTSFRLSLHKEVGSDFFQNCIDYAAQHKVQNLKLRGYVDRKPVTLPRLLLASSSLQTLHLHNATPYCMELPKSASLPNLKVLCLKNFVFSKENFNGEVFSGCPNLETLVLSKCRIRPRGELQVLDVNCLNLRNLEIRNWRSPWRCFNEHMINVDAPRLDFFRFQGHLARVNFKGGLLSLDRACFDLCYPTAGFGVNTTERKRRTLEAFLNTLRDICNVKFLSLSLKTIEVLCALPDIQERSPTIFENLRFIKFTAENKYREKTVPIKTLVRLLERAATDVLIFDGFKEQILSSECPKVKCKLKNASHITIPANVVHFLLESSPSAEFLTFEIPKVPSDKD